MDLEKFRRNVEDKGLKTGKLVFFGDAAFLPIKEHKDLTFLASIIYEFESKTDFTVTVLVKPNELALSKLREKKVLLSDKEYGAEQLKFLIEKQDFEIISLKNNAIEPLYFKFSKRI